MHVARNHWDECKKVKTVQELIEITAEETGKVKRLSLLCLLRIHRLVRDVRNRNKIVRAHHALPLARLCSYKRRLGLVKRCA